MALAPDSGGDTTAVCGTATATAGFIDGAGATTDALVGVAASVAAGGAAKEVSEVTVGALPSEVADSPSTT